MARIRTAKPKNSSGGYLRLVENDKLAEIFTKAQSTVITNRTELEKIISERSNVISNLDAFVSNVNLNKVGYGSYLCTKKAIFYGICHK